MSLHTKIGLPGCDLDRSDGARVSWTIMSRVIVGVLAVAACFGCAGAPPPASQMAPAQAAKPDPGEPRKPAPTVTIEPPAAISNDGIAARINNEIITWK